MTLRHVTPILFAAVCFLGPDAHGRKFSCDNLDTIMSRVNAPETLRFCQDALTSCQTMKMAEEHVASLWVKEAQPELESRHIQNMAACELAVMHYNPDYYQEGITQE